MTIRSSLIDPNGLVPVKKVKVKNPLTGKTAMVTIKLDGTQESELAQALVDPKASREYKDNMLSMYLFERGAESSSYILDLMRSKGAHTKETRVFKSQMRFDLERYAELFSEHLHNQAMRTAKILGIDIHKELQAYRDWLSLPKNTGRQNTYYDYAVSQSYLNTGFITIKVSDLPTREFCAMVSQAMFDLEEAQRFDDMRIAIKEARLQEKGYGVYVDNEGNTYSVNDPVLDKIIEEDRQSTEDIKNSDV